ncbi:tetratricopeptide repeat protein [Rhizobium binxianense]
MAGFYSGAAGLSRRYRGRLSHRRSHIEEFDRDMGDMDNVRSDLRQTVDIRSPVYDIFREWIKTNLPSEYEAGLLLKPSEVIAEGRLAYREGRYLQAASFFDQASSRFPDKAVHYREAAEAYSMAGLQAEALTRLRKALLVAENNQSIKKRLRELTRPSWLRRLGVLKETPYPIE